MGPLEDNRAAIREEYGLRDPRAMLKRIVALGPEGELTLPDGHVIRGAEVLGERRRGRKLVLLGDCCEAPHAVELGAGADLLVHEATNAYLPELGDKGGEDRLRRETFNHGHSTPEMAGEFARRLGAKSVLLTHFSQRYHPGNTKVMRLIAERAAAAAHLPNEDVAAAYDALAIPLWAPDRGKPKLPPEALAPPSREAQLQEQLERQRVWQEEMDQAGTNGAAW